MHYKGTGKHKPLNFAYIQPFNSVLNNVRQHIITTNKTCCMPLRTKGSGVRIPSSTPRRNGLCSIPIFLLQKNQSYALSFLLIRKRSHSRRLFDCKRPHNAFGSLPTFCEYIRSSIVWDVPFLFCRDLNPVADSRVSLCTIICRYFLCILRFLLICSYLPV